MKPSPLWTTTAPKPESGWWPPPVFFVIYPKNQDPQVSPRIPRHNRSPKGKEAAKRPLHHEPYPSFNGRGKLLSKRDVKFTHRSDIEVLIKARRMKKVWIRVFGLQLSWCSLYGCLPLAQTPKPKFLAVQVRTVDSCNRVCDGRCRQNPPALIRDTEADLLYWYCTPGSHTTCGFRF